MALKFTFNNRSCPVTLVTDNGTFVDGQEMYEQIEDSGVFLIEDLLAIAKLDDDEFFKCITKV